MTRAILRTAVLDEARSWIGTRFLHQGDLKGVGVDCLFLIVRTYQAAGCVGDIPDPRPYPRMWAARDDRYLRELDPYTVPCAAPLEPADIALFRIGRGACHAAIVVEWPKIIHAIPLLGVVETDARTGELPDRFVGGRRPLAIAEAA